MTNVSTYQGLIDVIDDANGDYPNPHTIDLTADIVLTSVEGNLFGPVGLPVIIGKVTINGNGYTISRSQAGGTPEFRLFAVNAKTSGNSDARLTLNNVVGCDGLLSNNGAAFMVNDADVELNGCHILNNVGQGTGAIYNGDGYSLTIKECIFADNVGTGTNARGGAIYNSSGSSLDIEDSIFANNLAQASGSQGGAIYRHNGGTVDIINSSFCNNDAPDGANIYNNPMAAIDATQCWWGVTEDPGDTIDGNGSGNVNYEPYRTTLPRFVATSEFSNNICLPPVFSDCKIKINSGQFANVYRGPSEDDLFVRDSQVDVVQLQQNQEVDARAQAEDEDGSMWYAFEDATNRPNYLSWVKEGTLQIIGDECEADELPQFDTIEDFEYGDNLNLTAFPLHVLKARDQKGFGLQESQYSNIPGSRHSGFDFFPADGESRELLAVADGIVVGMGRDADKSAKTPDTWGATEGGHNLIIRTEGYYLLYGHLAEIDDSLYYGARVFAGDVLGVLAELDGGTNTHLHLEVRTFTDQVIQDDDPIRCRFGAVKREGVSGGKPPCTTDPINFISSQGTFDSLVDTDPINVSRYVNAQLGGVSFDYTVADDLRLKCFGMVVGPFLIEDPANCDPADPCN